MMILWYLLEVSHSVMDTFAYKNGDTSVADYEDYKQEKNIL